MRVCATGQDLFPDTKKLDRRKKLRMRLKWNVTKEQRKFQRKAAKGADKEESFFGGKVVKLSAAVSKSTKMYFKFASPLSHLHPKVEEKH